MVVYAEDQTLGDVKEALCADLGEHGYTWTPSYLTFHERMVFLLLFFPFFARVLACVCMRVRACVCVCVRVRACAFVWLVQISGVGRPAFKARPAFVCGCWCDC